MKQFLLLFSLVFLTAAGNAQVVYVDAAATGAGDGSSWDDAYTDLAMAIDSADAGSSLWVAAGTYVTPDSSSFFINRELSLYGGFAGTETEAGAADPMANETILSGDVLGNDMEGTYDSLSMSDNNRVLLIQDTSEAVSAFTVTIDGFTIRDGAITETFPGGTASLIPYAGGGIYSDAKVNLSRILFTANRAEFGAATCLIFSTTNGSTYDNIVTRGNYPGTQSQHYIRLTDSVSITNSEFDGEGIDVSAGMIYTRNVGALVIDSCSFTDIVTSGNNGAAFYAALNQGQEITNSTFENCISGFGGAILIFGDAVANDSSTVIRNCEFTGNVAARTGGAIYIQDERFEMSDCVFANNSGTTGTVGMFGSADDYSFKNCTFTENGEGSPYFRGSAIYMALTGGERPDTMLVDSCTFNANVTTQEAGIVSGGAIFVSGDYDARPYVGITNSRFALNAAQEGADGAAMYLVDGVMIDIADSDFRDNSADGSGGAFFALQFTEEVTEVDTMTNDTTMFDRYPEDNTPEFMITRSLFLNNSSGNQGGVADLQTGQISMTNSLLIGNTVTLGEGSGGAIIINGTDQAPARLENVFVNNTFYNNADGGREGIDTLLGSAGNAIALYQPGNTDPDSNSVTLTIQNNAFFQLDPTEESLGIEQTGDDGEFVVNSLGGNYFNSGSQLNFPTAYIGGATDTTDLTVVDTDIFLDPLLVEFDTEYPNLDLIGEGTNPLINGGTTGELVPDVDFFNEPRDSMPDIGAIEFNGLRVDVAEPIADSGLELSFFPNPTTDVVNIVNSDAKVTRFTVLVSDMQGRFLKGQQFSAAQNTLDLSALPKGVYNLSLLINNKTYSQQVVKQ